VTAPASTPVRAERAADPLLLLPENARLPDRFPALRQSLIDARVDELAEVMVYAGIFRVPLLDGRVESVATFAFVAWLARNWEAIEAYASERAKPGRKPALLKIASRWWRRICDDISSGKAGERTWSELRGAMAWVRGNLPDDMVRAGILEFDRRLVRASDAKDRAPTLARRVNGAVSEADLLGAGGPEGEEAAAPLARLRTLTAEEFASDVAPEALVENMIYAASTHTITGASKAGKTWTALQIAMAACAGWPFLGLETVPARVLYLSFELSAGMLRGRMREIHAGTEIPLPTIGHDLHVVAPTAEYLPQLDLGTEEGCRELERLVGETGAQLVILDTLYRFLPGADPNDNGVMGRIFGRINDLAQRTGAALVLLDHVGKGEQLGPVSHSAIGASVKGGAARVVIALRRTSREDGGRWQLDVESHFGSWEAPIYYERPRLPDGTRGGGCSVCTAAEAHGLKFQTVRELFARHGDRDAQGRPFFASKRKLRDALHAAKLAAGNAQGDQVVDAVLRDYAVAEHAADRNPDRPIVTRDGPNRAVVITWRRTEPQSEEEEATR
jgi:hypothetical protein